MCKAYEARKEKGWPEKVDMPFAKDDDGMYSYKATLKGAYGKEATLRSIIDAVISPNACRKTRGVFSTCKFS